MTNIKFGPAGIGPVKDVEETFSEFKRLGIRAAEIPFTYSIFIKTKEQALKVKQAAEKFNISLSIHAPYWINLNSENSDVVEKSKQRILKCCEVGTWLNAKAVVFHPGYYGKNSREETFKKIKNEILDMLAIIKKNKWTPKLAPETTGKVNVFGGFREIAKLVEETSCSFCIDFAHILARYKTYSFKEIKKLFAKHKNWHVHFSGIEYSAKGERKHKITSEKNWEELLDNLPKNKNITIINEAPDPFKDTINGLKIWKNLDK